MDRFEPNIPSECQELSTDNHEDIRPDSSSNRVIIIDAMAILQGMKKTSGMTTIGHLKKAFLDKIMRLSNEYDETRLIFDHYIEIVRNLKQELLELHLILQKMLAMTYTMICPLKLYH